MEGTNVLDTIMTSATQLVEFSGECLTTMISNPIYAFLFAGCIVSVGLAIVRELKGTARG